MAALLTDPARVSAAAEEVLRVQPSGGSGGIPRYTRTGLDIDGTRVRAGELVLLDLGAANHDGSVFTDPDRFDVGRAGTRAPRVRARLPVLDRRAAGRIELAVFTQLIPRFPRMRLGVEPARLQVRQDSLTGGLLAIPVTW